MTPDSLPGERSDFSVAERERAAQYHRPLYAAVLVRLLLVILVYLLFARSRGIGGSDRLAAAAAWSAVVTLAAGLVCLPLDYWRFRYERRWGFARQRADAWLADRAKAEAIAVVLAVAVWTGTVELARALPRFWPLPAAAAAAVAVFVLVLLAPLVLEPVFNRFRPLEDRRLAGELRELAQRAGVPVRDVLVADASRRTSKTNAYVSGLGPTRRVVVWDTLLATGSTAEVELVVAHELGHRRARHVAKGTALAMAGAVVAVALVWVTFGTPAAQDFPLAALLVLGLEVAAMPVLAFVSRDWERAADRFSLELTGDDDAYVAAHLALARSNLSDLEPPRLAYLMLFTHPTPPERLALARARGVSAVSR